MALLGAQFVFTLLMTSIMQKQLLTASIAKFFLVRGLFGYVPPSDDELRSSANLPTRNAEKRKHAKSGKSSDAEPANEPDEFTVPRTTRVSLRRVPLAFFEPGQLPFFNEAASLMDFALYAAVVFIATEFYYATARSAASEFNLSTVWCSLTILFALKLLLTMTKRVYLRSDNPGELGLCISFAGVFLLLAMVTLTDYRDSVFELRLERSFTAFSNAAGKLIRKYSVESTEESVAEESSAYVDRRFVDASSDGEESAEDEYGPANVQAFKGIVALLSALFGACVVFPGMRFAKMYVDAIADCEKPGEVEPAEEETSKSDANGGNNAPPSVASKKSTVVSRLQQMLLHCVTFASLAVCLSYFRPLLDEVRASGKVSDADIASVRLFLVLLCSALRFVAARRLFQAHFELARRKVALMNREAGRISNSELRRNVARVVRYFGVVAAQLVAPALLAAYLALLVKVACGVTWLPPTLGDRITLFAPANQTATVVAANSTQDGGAGQLLAALHRVLPSSLGAILNATGFEPGVLDSARGQVSSGVQEVRELFSVSVLEGMLNYSVWWLHASWFVSTVFGLIYYSYFASAS